MITEYHYVTHSYANNALRRSRSVILAVGSFLVQYSTYSSSSLHKLSHRSTIILPLTLPLLLRSDDAKQDPVVYGTKFGHYFWVCRNTTIKKERWRWRAPSFPLLVRNFWNRSKKFLQPHARDIYRRKWCENIYYRSTFWRFAQNCSCYLSYLSPRRISEQRVV